jgi:hypothetical protein
MPWNVVLAALEYSNHSVLIVDVGDVTVRHLDACGFGIIPARIKAGALEVHE